MTDSPNSPGRGRRADAMRNAQRLLDAARALLDESGPDVALDEVARRAGVGNATLYRHFPTRVDLLVAVYADEVAALCQRADDLAGHPSPIDGLFAWLDEYVVHVSTKRTLALAATEGPAVPRTRLFDQWHASMRAAATALLDRARTEGVVRPDLTATDLLALARGATLGGTDLAHARRLLLLLRDGIVTSLPTRRASASPPTK